MAIERDVSRIKEKGWRQGSVFPSTLVDSLTSQGVLATPSVGQTLFLVVSHDCDVTNASLASEPFVEVVPVRPLRSDDRKGNLFWGKNPRRYQFRDTSSGEDLLFELSIHDICKLPREHLCGFGPDQSRSISDENLSRIRRWIALRYTRASFPDAFNERTRDVVKRLRSTFKERGELLSAIFVHLDDDRELEDDEVYEIIIWATMREDDYEQTEQRVLAQQIVDMIETEFQHCDGLEIDAVELRSESDVSFADLRRLRRWDFDDLTLRDESQAAIPPTD